MKKLLLIICCFVTSAIAYAQSNTITGTITDPESQKPIEGASIVVKGNRSGTVTDTYGKFTLTTNASFPLTLVVSSVGFEKKEIEVSAPGQDVSIQLIPRPELIDEVVFSASRVEENILQSPVSIEKMDTRAIRETASMSFYDGLQNIKGVEMVTS